MPINVTLLLDMDCHGSYITTCLCPSAVFLLTLHYEVDEGDVGLVARLQAAQVEALVGHGHVLDLDGVVAAVAVDQRDARVQSPLVLAGEEDAGTVQPGLVGNLHINPTPEGAGRR